MPELETTVGDVHRIVFASPHAYAALGAVERALVRSGAELAQLSLKPVGRIIETTLKVRGLSDAEADALAEALAKGSGVNALRIEHHRGLA